MLTAEEREACIERYARGAALVLEAVARVPEEARKWRPAPERWSVHEIACHCADAEVNGASRIRYLAAQEGATIVGYDQARWATALDYHSLPLEPALRCLEAARAYTAPLIRRLPEAAWTREGRHTETGRYSAEDWLLVYAEHLEKHAAQIDRNLQAWRARQEG